MKRVKTLAALVLSASMLTAAAVSAQAYELTQDSDTGDTEVTATVSGTEPGDVRYIITVPDTIDFGTLYQYDDEESHVKTVDYTVEATLIENLDTSADYSRVAVYVKDQNANIDDDSTYAFTLYNKSDNSISLTYDVYNGIMGEDGVSFDILNFTTYGYGLIEFSEQGETLTGQLALDQAQLTGKDLDTYAGDYSGYMTFHSELV